MAISWMHRQDYEEAGFKMLVHANNGFKRTARKSLVYTIILIALSFAPYWTSDNDVSLWYLILNSLLSAYALYHAIRFLDSKNQDANARSLFFSTILYLPLFMILFALDRYM
jgi:protoheme IX farnesyltransferase